MSRFDAAYYRRFYLNPSTRAATVHDARRQAAFICAYLKYLGVPVRRVLDLGCGLGRTLRAISHEFPKARCVGVEHSAYLCKRYGWTHASAVDYHARTPFDLVVCNDVLPSLNEHDCALALQNLAKLSRGALFLGAITVEDGDRVDKKRTDKNVFLRPASWYRRRLARHFEAVGGGLYLKKPHAVVIWELDRSPL
jgi:predicted TPR repeat methyltransferase